MKAVFFNQIRLLLPVALLQLNVFLCEAIGSHSFAFKAAFSTLIKKPLICKLQLKLLLILN